MLDASRAGAKGRETKGTSMDFKAFTSTFAALLLTLLVGWSLHSHEKWSDKYDSAVASLDTALSDGAKAHTSESLNSTIDRIRLARRDVLEGLAEKTLPLTGEQRKLRDNCKDALSQSWTAAKIQFQESIANIDSEKVVRGGTDFRIFYRESYIAAIRDNLPFSKDDLPLIQTMESEIEALR